MPLSQQDQLNLLKDILNNHQLDCCGTMSELEQLERLIKTLLVNPEISYEAKDLLTKIYTYSQKGINASDLDSHIEAHQPQLSQWVQEMEQFS